jgi:hypothetical protein
MCEWFSPRFRFINDAANVPWPNQAIRITTANKPPAKLSLNPSQPNSGPPARLPTNFPSCPTSLPRFAKNAISKMAAHAAINNAAEKPADDLSTFVVGITCD